MDEKMSTTISTGPSARGNGSGHGGDWNNAIARAFGKGGHHDSRGGEHGDGCASDGDRGNDGSIDGGIARIVLPVHASQSGTLVPQHLNSPTSSPVPVNPQLVSSPSAPAGHYLRMALPFEFWNPKSQLNKQVLKRLDDSLSALSTDMGLPSKRARTRRSIGDSDSRAPQSFLCTEEGCTKVYKSFNGLTYHLEHAHGYTSVPKPSQLPSWSSVALPFEDEVKDRGENSNSFESKKRKHHVKEKVEKVKDEEDDEGREDVTEEMESSVGRRGKKALKKELFQKKEDLADGWHTGERTTVKGNEVRTDVWGRGQGRGQGRTRDREMARGAIIQGISTPYNVPAVSADADALNHFSTRRKATSDIPSLIPQLAISPQKKALISASNASDGSGTPTKITSAKRACLPILPSGPLQYVFGMFPMLDALNLGYCPHCGDLISMISSHAHLSACPGLFPPTLAPLIPFSSLLSPLTSLAEGGNRVGFASITSNSGPPNSHLQPLSQSHHPLHHHHQHAHHNPKSSSLHDPKSSSLHGVHNKSRHIPSPPLSSHSLGVTSVGSQQQHSQFFLQNHPSSHQRHSHTSFHHPRSHHQYQHAAASMAVLDNGPSSAPLSTANLAALPFRPPPSASALYARTNSGNSSPSPFDDVSGALPCVTNNTNVSADMPISSSAAAGTTHPTPANATGAPKKAATSDIPAQTTTTIASPLTDVDGNCLSPLSWRERAQLRQLEASNVPRVQRTYKRRIRMA